jgi:hypothetical protein
MAWFLWGRVNELCTNHGLNFELTCGAGITGWKAAFINRETGHWIAQSRNVSAIKATLAATNEAEFIIKDMP